MKCGDIILVNYPFTDGSGSKIRPAVIVSSDAYNGGADLLIAPISSVLESEEQFSFPIRTQDSSFVETGLKQASTVKWTKILTISRSVIQRKLGALRASPMSTIHEKIRSIFA